MAPPRVEPEAEADPFDPARLRLSQDFASETGARKIITTIPVRKPSNEDFIRTHSDQDEYWLETLILELKTTRDYYLIAPGLRELLLAEPTCSPRLLVTTVTRAKGVLLWPIRIADAQGRIDPWNRSALAAAVQAQTGWVRVAGNTSLGHYEVTTSTWSAEPEFPDLPMKEILRIAFGDRYISNPDHVVLRQLRGEI